MIRASHAFWSSCVEAGLDQVIDDVWVIPEQPTWLERALSCGSGRTSVGKTPKYGGFGREPRYSVLPSVAESGAVRQRRSQTDGGRRVSRRRARLRNMLREAGQPQS